jgi:hypothetical protein
MSELNDAGRRLLGWIVSRFARVIPGDPRSCLGYQEAHDDLGLSQQGKTYGMSLRRQGLDALADWSKETSKPAITGLIIDRETLEPGEGYFKLFGMTTPDYRWWEDQVRQSLAFDWSPYLGPPAADTQPAASLPTTPPPNPPPGPQPPPRVETTSYQIVRDSEVVRRVKELLGDMLEGGP